MRKGRSRSPHRKAVKRKTELFGPKERQSLCKRGARIALSHGISQEEKESTPSENYR